MKPLRPAWITILAVICLLVATVWTSWAFGPFIALAPLALTLAFIYDLTHHAKSRSVKIYSRVIVCLALAVVIVVGVYYSWVGSLSF